MGIKIRSKPLVVMAVIILSMVIHPSVANAHKLNVFAYFENDAVVGEAYFSDGAPARDCDVVIKDLRDGVVICKSHTDKEGKFVISVGASKKGDFLIIVNAGMGHQGQTTISLPAQEDVLTTRAGEKSYFEESKDEDELLHLREEDLLSLMRTAVRSELDPLRSELLQLRKELSSPGFSEIMGGIGYIFGLVGVILWVKGEKKS
jgi:nickel transport protein